MTKTPLRATSLSEALTIAQDFLPKLWCDDIHNGVIDRWNKARRSRRVATYGVQAKTVHKWVAEILNERPKVERRSTR